MEKRRHIARRIVIGAVVVLAIAAVIGGVFVRRLEARADAADHIIDGNPTSEELATYLRTFDERLIVGNAMTLLEHRADPIAVEEAARFLASDDSYIWLPAALYLGAVDDARAVPYLIRGLPHPARKTCERIPAYLHFLTGEDFGREQEKWIDWWRAAHPNEEFDFTIDPEGLGAHGAPRPHSPH